MDNDKLGRTSNGIKKILETEIAPMLAMHGGRVEFVSFEEGTVKIRLKGACHGCALSELTLKEGVERILKEKIRKIKSVENVEPR
ncbi:MAG: NifU family protein [Candidatus Niyogibacteria bacterium]|nr:NifU family protein [Candidatus Niyogibacteria bacterium]